MGAKHKQIIFLLLTLAIAACSKSKDVGHSPAPETPAFSAFDSLKENQIDRLDEVNGCAKHSFEIAFTAVIEELSRQNREKSEALFLNTPSLKAISLFTETQVEIDERRTENPPRPIKSLYNHQTDPNYGTGIPAVIDIDDLSTPNTFVDYRVYLLNDVSCNPYYHEVFSYHSSPEKYFYRGKIFFHDKTHPFVGYEAAPLIAGVKVSVLIGGVPIDHLYTYTNAEGEFEIQSSNVRLTGLNNVQLQFEHPEYQISLSDTLHALSDPTYQRLYTISR